MMKQAIIRLVVLVVLLINQTLLGLGWSSLSFSEEQMYEVISSVVLVSVALFNWYKNNNLTKEAVNAQGYLDHLKENKSLKKNIKRMV